MSIDSAAEAEIMKVVYNVIKTTYAPVEQKKEIAIEQTVNSWLSSFPTVSKEDFQEVVEKAWVRHVQENGKNQNSWQASRGRHFR